MLWIALYLPQLPLQLAERCASAHPPLAISDGSMQRPAVVCANEAAREGGVRPGMAVAAAKALMGELRVKVREAGEDLAALERLAAWVGQFTSAVAIRGGEGLLLEVETSVKLFAGLAKLLAKLRVGVSELGFRAAIGIAPTPHAAWLFAKADESGIAVRSCSAIAELPARLADLPLFLLDWPDTMLARLADLGLVRVGDVLALPRAGFRQRFGAHAAADLDRLVGTLPDPKVFYIPPECFGAKLELPMEAATTEAILFPLKRLLGELEGFLRARGKGVQQLHITLGHSHGRTRVAIELAAPDRDAARLTMLAREKLERVRLSQPTLTVALEADRLLEFAPGNASWLPERENAKLGANHLVERLTARLGNSRVFGIALGDDHRPERAWRNGTAAPARAAYLPRRPLWLLPTPQSLIAGGKGPKLQGELELLAGPERIETGWWDGEAVNRDYFVARNPAGETFWIYREHHRPAAWYLHGVFS
jgi:protein ImuB